MPRGSLLWYVDCLGHRKFFNESLEYRRGYGLAWEGRRFCHSMILEKRTDHFSSAFQEDEQMRRISPVKGDLPFFCTAWGTLNPNSPKSLGPPNPCAPSGQILGVHE